MPTFTALMAACVSAAVVARGASGGTALEASNAGNVTVAVVEFEAANETGADVWAAVAGASAWASLAVVPAGALSKSLASLKGMAKYEREGGLHVTKVKVTAPGTNGTSGFARPGVNR